MNKTNPINQALKKQMQKIEIHKQSDVQGIVEDINYSKRTCSIQWKDTKTYATQYSYNVPLNDGKNSLFSGELQRGDIVTLGFKNNSLSSPYIVNVQKRLIDKNYSSKNGASIPKFFNK